MQLWDRALRAQAAALIDDPSLWLDLYWLEDLRTAKGATGFLFRAWPGPWAVHHATAHGDAPADALAEPPVLVSAERPSRQAQIDALNAALAAAREQDKAAKRGGWPG